LDSESNLPCQVLYGCTTEYNKDVHDSTQDFSKMPIGTDVQFVAAPLVMGILCKPMDDWDPLLIASLPWTRKACDKRTCEMAFENILEASGRRVERRVGFIAGDCLLAWID